MIEAIGLTKRFGRRTAIKNVSFRVEQGEILGFLGPNGSGKTTTMRILTGYMPPNKGGASIAGHDVLSDSIAARKKLGYLPENVPLYPEMSVAGYLDYMARLRHLPNRRAAIQRAMEMVHIEDHANRRIAKLSKGYRQRVGLAQALLHDPPVLILDEPTVGLDPRQIIEVRELIRQLSQERTIILSTHMLPEVSQLCNRVVILNEGSIAAIDTPDELTNRLQGIGRRVHLQVEQPAPDAAEKIGSLDGVSEVEETKDGTFEVACSHDTALRPALAKLVVEQGWGLLELRPVGMSMEEIFLKLTTDEDLEEPYKPDRADRTNRKDAQEEPEQEKPEQEEPGQEKPEREEPEPEREEPEREEEKVKEE